MSKLARFWQINGLYDKASERLSSAQPLAYKFEQVSAVDFSRLTSEQQQALFDQEHYLAQGFEGGDLEFQASRALSHLRVLQHVAANASIADQDLVLITEAGTILSTHWYRLVQSLVAEFNRNSQLNCVILSNDLVKSFDKLPAEQLAQHCIFTKDELTHSLGDSLTNTDLCYTHNLRMVGASAYLIRKSAIKTSVQNLVDVNAILAQDFSSTQHKTRVSWVAEAFHQYFEYAVRTLAYTNPCLAVSAYGTSSKGRIISHAALQQLAQAKTQQYISSYHQADVYDAPFASDRVPSPLWQQQEQALKQARELASADLLPYIDQGISCSAYTHPQAGFDRVSKIKKYVLADQGFRTENHNQLGLFFAQDHTNDFEPVFYPREHDADMQAYYQAHPAIVTAESHLVLPEIVDIRYHLVLRRLFSQIISDPSLSDHDYVLVVGQDYVFTPDWYHQLNQYLTYMELLFPENNYLILAKPSYPHLGFIDGADFSKYLIVTQQQYITNFSYSLGFANALESLDSNPFMHKAALLSQSQLDLAHKYTNWSQLACPVGWSVPHQSYSYAPAQFIALTNYRFEEQDCFLIRVGCLRQERDYIFGDEFNPYDFSPIVLDGINSIAVMNPPLAFKDRRLAQLRFQSHYHNYNLPEAPSTAPTSLYPAQAANQVPDYLATTPKFLINLEKETDRLRFMKTQAGIEDFEVVPAVDAREFSPQQLAQFFNIPRFEQANHRYPITGEIGCTLSHCKIYQQILADDTIPDDQFVMIIEDDCKFFAGWQDRVNQLLHYLHQHHLDQVNLVLLAHIMISEGEKFSYAKLEKTTYLFLDQSSPYTISPDLDFNFLVGYYPHGSSCYLVRKGALRKYEQDINFPYWVADNFPYCVDFNHGTYGIINPVASTQNYNLNSVIADERNQADRRRRQKLQQVPVFASDVNDYIEGYKYLIQHQLSDEELAAKFPLDQFVVFKYVDYKQLSPEEFNKVYDLEGFKANYGRLPTDDEINRALTHFQIYQYIDKLDDNGINFFLVVEDDVELTPDYITNANIVIRYVDTRLSLLMRFIQLSSSKLGSAGKDKLSLEQLADHQIYGTPDKLYNCNPDLQVFYCNNKYRDGCKMYLGLNMHIRGERVAQRRVSWLADDFPRFITYTTDTILYTNPCLGIDHSEEA